jgi:hypothetical protein
MAEPHRQSGAAPGLPEHPACHLPAPSDRTRQANRRSRRALLEEMALFVLRCVIVVPGSGRPICCQSRAGRFAFQGKIRNPKHGGMVTSRDRASADANPNPPIEARNRAQPARADNQRNYRSRSFRMGRIGFQDHRAKPPLSVKYAKGCCRRHRS